MWQKIKVVILSSLLSWFLITIASADVAKMTATDPLKSILVKKSAPEFTIIVASNPTTGFTWALKNYDDKLIAPVGKKFYPSPNKKLIGAGGFEKWTFRVKPEGFVVPMVTNITLIYARSWEQQGAQASTFKVVTYNDD